MSLMEKTFWVGVGPRQTRTQVLSLLPKENKLKKLLVFIPGNPGVIQFYKPFLYDLLERLGKGVGVLGISQAGHCGGKPFTNVGLEAQVEHKVHFFDLLAKHPIIFGLSHELAEELIVMSHSLGSYLGLKSLARFPNIPITKFIGLFPTIQHLRHGIPLPIRISARPVLRQSLAGLVHVMPKRAREVILAWYCGQSEEAKYLLDRKVHQYGLVNNVLALAWDEVKSIGQIDDECHQYLNFNSNKISLVFGHKDPYVPLRFYWEMQESYPDIDIELASEEVPHDFVFDHNRTVAEQVAGKIGF